MIEKIIGLIMYICKAKTLDLYAKTFAIGIFFVFCARFIRRWTLFWRDARVVEEARLESVYTPKAYRGFESRSLRIDTMKY